MNFCRFEGEINGVKKTYYAWQYSESIRMILYYPLMVVDDKNGERKDRTEWHRVVIFSPGLADVAEKYLKKGSKVYVEGQLRTRKWQDASGADRYSTEIVLSGFNAYMIMLDKTSGDFEPSEEGMPSPDAGWDNSTPSGDIDDEIPF